MTSSQQTQPQTLSPGELAWFEIHVGDLERAAAFYGAVFGWTLTPLADFPLGEYRLATPERGGEPVAGLALDTGHQRPERPTSIGYLFVDDIPSSLDAAVAAGGTVLRPQMNIGGEHGHAAVITDVDGNQLGLWSTQ
jgi:predicted enzyme related to lactoylglutathione lyase